MLKFTERVLCGPILAIDMYQLIFIIVAHIVVVVVVVVPVLYTGRLSNLPQLILLISEAARSILDH